MRSGLKLLQGGALALLVCTLVGVRQAGAQANAPADAQRADAPEARASDRLRCVSLSSIDRTEVIDDRTVAFYLIGGRVYLNHLDRACRNLARDRPFSYQTSTGQLCSVDVINVIEGFGPGANFGDTCGLGEFVLSDEEEVEILQGEREPIEVEAEEVEVEEAEIGDEAD